jgi:hypothetical protein
MTEEQKKECERWAEFYEMRAKSMAKLYPKYENKVLELEECVNSQIAAFEKEFMVKIISLPIVPEHGCPVSGKTVNLLSYPKIDYYATLAIAQLYREHRPPHLAQTLQGS